MISYVFMILFLIFLIIAFEMTTTLHIVIFAVLSGLSLITCIITFIRWIIRMKNKKAT
jgi:hypothetical protein